MDFAFNYIVDNGFLHTIELVKLRPVCREFNVPCSRLPGMGVLPYRWYPRYPLPGNMCYLVLGSSTIIFNADCNKFNQILNAQLN